MEGGRGHPRRQQHEAQARVAHPSCWAAARGRGTAPARCRPDPTTASVARTVTAVRAHVRRPLRNGVHRRGQARQRLQGHVHQISLGRRRSRSAAPCRRPVGTCSVGRVSLIPDGRSIMSNSSAAAPSGVPFNLNQPLPTGRASLEASAGTGKTYALTALIVRYIAERGITADQLLVVTFTRAAVTELRDRTRSMLGIAAQALLPNADLADTPQWLIDVVRAATSAGRAEQQRRHLLDAIARFDELSITTIHGFCQQALGQLGLRAGNNPDAELVDNSADIVAEVCRDLLISQLADNPALLSDNSSSKPTTPSQVETSLIDAVSMVIGNPGARLVPTADTALVEDDITEALARRWSDLVLRACAEVKSRQQARGEIGYDSLITDLHDALLDPA
ncbi:MAG: AAA family ATPase, partial [Actinobacteria bacterium]|nr:AAA family ATPase [Actinomycetota bacterium]